METDSHDLMLSQGYIPGEEILRDQVAEVAYILHFK
jgi:hypothetical protein